MKRFFTISFFCFIVIVSSSQTNNVINYSLPDSVKAISFLAEISVGPITTKKEQFIGIKTDIVKLSFESDKKEREIVFEFPKGSQIMANGLGIKTEKDELSWKFDWSGNEKYKLMIATASDSSGNFALYSGYIFLPGEKKWKLIGTCKIAGQWNTLKQPAVFYSEPKKDALQAVVTEAWCQRQNGSWKNMLSATSPSPVVNLFSHVDSLEQLRRDKMFIAIYTASSAKTHQDIQDTFTYKENNNVYFAIKKEGTGRQVSVNDTVTVFYKGYLLNGSVFDETKDKPATFPLKRLIMGWQIGVPLCKVGGKIKIIIPSNLAYSIRTRAAKIPPNSILVFEIEVVDAKAPQ